jgi:hypothetical protein
VGRVERNFDWPAPSGPPSSPYPSCLSNERTNPIPSAMATATLLGSSFAMPAAARRASSSASTSLGFATSQLAGLSLSAGAATPTAVAFLPKRQQLQPIVARKPSVSPCCCFPPERAFRFSGCSGLQLSRLFHSLLVV